MFIFLTLLFFICVGSAVGWVMCDSFHRNQCKILEEENRMIREDLIAVLRKVKKK